MRYAAETWADPTECAPPRVVVEFDPDSRQADPRTDVDPAAPWDLSRAYDEEDWWLAKPQPTRPRYAAWHVAFPWVVGEGDTAHDALAALAAALRAESWREESSPTRPGELLRAAGRLGHAELVAYLEMLSTLPQLADGYGLVLR